MDLIVDTCVLIEFQRGRQNASDALSRSDRTYAVNWIVLGELLEGQDEVFVRKLTLGIRVFDLDMETAVIFGDIRRTLRTSGFRVGDHDIWIAATAIRHGFGVLTNNLRDFRRISNLAVVSY